MQSDISDVRSIAAFMPSINRGIAKFAHELTHMVSP
jgi:hypothetical protein